MNATSKPSTSGQTICVVVGLVAVGLLGLNAISVFDHRKASLKLASANSPQGEWRNVAPISSVQSVQAEQEPERTDADNRSVYERSLIYSCQSCDGLGWVYTVEGLSNRIAAQAQCPICKGKGDTGNTPNQRQMGTFMSRSAAQNHYLGSFLRKDATASDGSSDGGYTAGMLRVMEEKRQWEAQKREEDAFYARKRSIEGY